MISPGDPGASPTVSDPVKAAGNMVSCVTYLIGVASNVGLHRVVSTLLKVQAELLLVSGHKLGQSDQPEAWHDAQEPKH